MTLLTVVLALGGAAHAASPVVVELFTSQGCSSCPDADAVISQWGKSEFKKGKVLPLSFNVDYWNYLGWRDLFSTPVYSRRQRRYASALGVGVYTPQMVVAGRSAFVGSNGAKAAAEVRRLEERTPLARLHIAASDSSRVKLTITAETLQEWSGNLHVMLALFENDLVTEVESGENTGHDLRADFVVRRLIDLGPLKSGFQRSLDDPWDPGWRKDRAGAAVFVQDMDSLETFAAASLFPLSR